MASVSTNDEVAQDGTLRGRRPSHAAFPWVKAGIHMKLNGLKNG